MLVKTLVDVEDSVKFAWVVLFIVFVGFEELLRKLTHDAEALLALAVDHVESPGQVQELF